MRYKAILGLPPCSAKTTSSVYFSLQNAKKVDRNLPVHTRNVAPGGQGGGVGSESGGFSARCTQSAYRDVARYTSSRGQDLYVVTYYTL